MRQALKNLIARPKWTGLSRRISYEDKQKFFEVCGYEPHHGQAIMHASRARFKVAACGRRFGKTTGFATHEIIPIICMGGLAHNVAPDHPTAAILFNSVLQTILSSQLAELVIDANTAEGKQALWLTTGGVLEAKSSSSLNRGKGPDYIHFDEATFEPDSDPWRFALKASLMDHGGGAGFTFTPKGHDWVKDLWDQGQDESPKWDDWDSWRFSSYDNPTLPEGEIEEYCSEATEDEIEQEIKALFIDAVGSVFRGYGLVSDAILQREPIPGHTYIVGVDPARVQDFCGICVFDVTAGCWAYAERFNQTDWATIRERVAYLSEFWGFCPVIVDATNQSAWAEELATVIDWATVYPFTFTAQSKAQIIREYALGIAKKEVHLLARDQPDPDDGDVDHEAVKAAKIAHSEHGWFRYEINQLTRNVKMQAPTGKTDDMVCAGALAYHMALHFLCEAPIARQPSEEEQASSMVGKFGRHVDNRPAGNFARGRGGFEGFSNRRRR